MLFLLNKRITTWPPTWKFTKFGIEIYLMSNLSTKISQLMAQQNITANAIEQTTGLSKNTIYSILAGNSKNPSAHNLQLIAQALNVTVESILIGTEEIQITSLSDQQLKVFEEITTTTINIIIERQLNFSFSKLIALLKEIYQYTLQTTPHSIDEKFINWLLEKYKN